MVEMLEDIFFSLIYINGIMAIIMLSFKFLLKINLNIFGGKK